MTCVIASIDRAPCALPRQKYKKNYVMRTERSSYITTHDARETRTGKVGYFVRKRYARASSCSPREVEYGAVDTWPFSSPTRVTSLTSGTSPSSQPRIRRLLRSVRRFQWKIRARCSRSFRDRDDRPGAPDATRRGSFFFFTERADSRSSSTCCRAPRPCRADCAPSGWCWSGCRDTS